MLKFYSSNKGIKKKADILNYMSAFVLDFW